jgi:hypothetical protein
MSIPRLPRLPRSILNELEGHQWKLKPGRRHWQIWIDGRMAALWSYGSHNLRPSGHAEGANTVASIRRAIRRRLKP